MSDEFKALREKMSFPLGIKIPAKITNLSETKPKPEETDPKSVQP